MHHSQPKIFFQNRNSKLKQQHTVLGRDNNLKIFLKGFLVLILLWINERSLK